MNRLICSLLSVVGSLYFAGLFCLVDLVQADSAELDLMLKAGSRDYESISRQLVDLAITDPGQLTDSRVAAARKMEALYDKLTPMIISTLRSRLVEFSPSLSSGLKMLVEKMYDVKSDEAKKILHMFSTAEQAEKLVLGGKEEEMIALYSQVLPPDEKEVVTKYFVKFVAFLAEKYTKENKPVDSLRILSLLSTEQASKQHLVRLRDALKATAEAGLVPLEYTEPGQIVFLASDNFHKLLQALEKQDSSAIAATVEIMVWATKRFMLLEQTDLAYKTLVAVQIRRPDPDELNNRWYTDLILSAATPVQQDFARGRVEDLKRNDGFSPYFRFRLLIGGWYYTNWLAKLLGLALVFIVISAVLAFGFLLALRKFAPKLVPRFISRLIFRETRDNVEDAEFSSIYGNGEEDLLEEIDRQGESHILERMMDRVSVAPSETRSQRERRTGWGTSAYRDQESQDKEKQKNKSSARVRRARSTADEYSRLLAIVGLPNDASEDDINKLYRQFLKAYHPDVRAQIEGATPEELDEEFRVLKGVFKRLLDIRKRMFNLKK